VLRAGRDSRRAAAQRDGLAITFEGRRAFRASELRVVAKPSVSSVRRAIVAR
jgi:hypothetical protein